MRNLLLLIALAMLQPIASIAQTSSSISDSSKITEQHTLNALATAYEGCQQANQTLSQQVDDCSKYQEEAKVTIKDASASIANLNRELEIKDSIAYLQQQKINNLQSLAKVNSKISDHRIIGFCLGGFAVGVAGTTICAILLKR